jgi:hypothetical protein
MTNLERFCDIAIESGIPIQDRDAWMRVHELNSEVWPIQKDGQMIGGVLFFGETVHIAVKPEWKKRWATREMLRAYPTWTPLIDVLAPIAKTNLDSIRLAEHLGLERSRETDTHYIYVKRKYEPTTQQA